jgi:hypothetical protein
MTESFTVLIMMPPHGTSPVERWVSHAIQASGMDLITRIMEIDVELEIYVLAAEEQDRFLAEKHGAHVLKSQRETFHFGKALIDFILEKNIENLAYFGSGSAPLLTKEMLQGAFTKVLQANHPHAVVNNLHSTDWAIFTNAKSISVVESRLPNDNPIGWILMNEMGFDVEALPISAGTRADIDTPNDIIMMHSHPNLGPNLQKFYSKSTILRLDRVKTLQTILSTPASHLTLIGRASSHIWHELERKTQIWVRIFVEERGMIASGRMERGEVRSLVAEMVDLWGPYKFVDYLETLSDGVLWDSRVWMAHHGKWPSKADRFASDLGHVDEILDPSLKTMTEAINQANIPIIMGGHGVVAGGLYALLETVFPK